MANKFNKVKPGRGVSEWAAYSYNIGVGCSNDCLYCYARDISLELGLIHDRAAWKNELDKPRKAEIHEKADGIVMFPSMHDITENYLATYLSALKNMLEAGNQVVIVTKPRLESVRAICEKFGDFSGKILFRMTITSLDAELSKLWEPGAPLPAERVEALKYAYEAGFQTSVSVEPMIDTVEHTIELYHTLYPYLTEDIWFGKMNDIDKRIMVTDETIRQAVQTIKDQQSDKNIYRLYRELKDAPKVEWKDSIRRVVGL